ncbi:hypothetical protein EVAR_48093_1 [Eumeta japonica]|uniref:Uncharacterized protein n=1 Tax=Eumeta variegata TaxID=151549 RepID=A0A4C1XNN1_EUMVA|nr:hypothetical protein EVAR_48093_1 [Eumeta japonica]
MQAIGVSATGGGSARRAHSDSCEICRYRERSRERDRDRDRDAYYREYRERERDRSRSRERERDRGEHYSRAHSREERRAKSPRDAGGAPDAEAGAESAGGAKPRAAAPYYDERYRERRERDAPPPDRERDHRSRH